MNSLHYNIQDIIDALRLHNSPKTSHLIVAGVVILIFSWSSFILNLIEKNIAFGILISIPISSLSWYYLHLPSRAKRILNQQKNLARETFFSWDSDGLICCSEIGKTKSPWSDFINIKENKKTILIYHSDHLFLIFPKHCFSGIDELNSFRSHLLDKLNS